MNMKATTSNHKSDEILSTFLNERTNKQQGEEYLLRNPLRRKIPYLRKKPNEEVTKCIKHILLI